MEAIAQGPAFPATTPCRYIPDQAAPNLAAEQWTLQRRWMVSHRAEPKTWCCKCPCPPCVPCPPNSLRGRGGGKVVLAKHSRKDLFGPCWMLLFFQPTLERGRKSVLDFKLHDDLPRAPVHGQNFAECWIEIVLQHHRPGFFEKEIGSVRHGSASQNAQFFAVGNMLHDARHPGDAQLAKGERTMAAVVQDQPVFRVD